MKPRIPGKVGLTDLGTLINEILDVDNNKSTLGSKVIRAIIQSMKDALRRGESIEIQGFGKFVPWTYTIYAHKPLIGTHKGQPIQSSAPQSFTRTRARFFPSIQLRAMLNMDNPTERERNEAMSRW